MSTPQQPQDPRIPRPDPRVYDARPSDAEPSDARPPGPGAPPGPGVPPGPGISGPSTPGPAYQPTMAVPHSSDQPTQAVPYPMPQPYQPGPFEPDWTAMADQHAATKRRKKRVLLSVIAAVLVVGVGGAAAFLTLGGSEDGDGKGKGHQAAGATKHPSASPSTSPSASPVPAATMFGRDLFKAKTLRANGETYTRVVAAHTRPCWKATRKGLGPLLEKNKCRQILTATYASKKNAVTVGVIVFDNSAQAAAVASSFTGELRPLTLKDKPGHCADDKVDCAVTKATHGVYVYTTLAGPVSGKPGDKDPDSVAAGNAVAAYALQRLMALE